MSSGQPLSIVGSRAEGHGGDADDLGEGGFKATERTNSKREALENVDR